MSIHVHRHQEFHEGSLAVDINLIAWNDLNKLIFTENSAANGIDSPGIPPSTSSKKVCDHQKIYQMRVTVILYKRKIIVSQVAMQGSEEKKISYPNSENLPSETPLSFRQ